MDARRGIGSPNSMASRAGSGLEVRKREQPSGQGWLPDPIATTNERGAVEPASRRWCRTADRCLSASDACLRAAASKWPSVVRVRRDSPTYGPPVVCLAPVGRRPGARVAACPWVGWAARVLRFDGQGTWGTGQAGENGQSSASSGRRRWIRPSAPPRGKPEETRETAGVAIDWVAGRSPKPTACGLPGHGGSMYSQATVNLPSGGRAVPPGLVRLKRPRAKKRRGGSASAPYPLQPHESPAPGVSKASQ